MIPRYPEGDPTAVLRLEVEDTEAPGLVNKVPNPSGDLGAWGWITPHPGQLLEAKPWQPLGNALYLRSASAPDNTVRSVSRPVTPGRWVAAAWTVLFLDANASARVRVTFLDASAVEIASTPWVTAAETGRASIPATQVPASAVEAYVVIEMGNGAAFPLTYGGYVLAFRDVALAEADAADEFGISRTNLFTDDPSFEAALTGRWDAGQGVELTRTTSVSVFGSGALMATATFLGAWHDYMAFEWHADGSLDGGPIVVERGRDYTLSVSALAENGAVALDVNAAINYADGTSQPLGAIGKDATAAEGGPVRLSRVFTVPAGEEPTAEITSIKWSLGGSGRGQDVDAGDWHILDGIMVEAGPVAGEFVTGTQVITDLANLAPMAFRNIIAPALDVTVVRSELDASTLTAEIVSASLDPATSPLLRPRRVTRLRAYVAGEWETLFVGEVETASVTYDPLDPDPESRARISLTALGNETVLARTPMPDVVAEAADVPHLVEGAGVPWDVDGSPNGVANPTVVLTNENASALDGVALVRDSIHGYAWVGREGVLRFRSGLPAVGVELHPYGTFDAPEVADRYASLYGTLSVGADADPDRAPYHARFGKDAEGPFMLTTYGQAAADRMPATAGQAYAFEWDTRANSGARLTRVAPIWYDATGNILAPEPLYEWGQYVPNSSTWQTFSEEYVAPPGAVGMAIGAAVLATDFDPETETAATPIPANEVHLFDNLSIKVTAGVRALTPEQINPALVVDYDMARVVNIVTVKRQYLDGLGEAQEVIYGPYSDAASITEFGRRPVEFTVVGVTAEAAEEWAGAVLAANAHPARALLSATVPIDYTGPDGTLVTTDLYDAVTYTDPDLSLDQSLRVVGVRHRITSEGHLLDLDFAAEGTVAPPQAPPALPSGAPVGVPRIQYVGGANMASIPNTQWTTPTGWDVEAPLVGFTHVMGSKQICDVDGTYLVSGSLTFVGDPVAGRRLARLLIDATGGGGQVEEWGVASARATVGIHTVVNLKAGQTIDFQVWQQTDGNLGVEPHAACWWRVYRIGD